MLMASSSGTSDSNLLRYYTGHYMEESDVTYLITETGGSSIMVCRLEKLITNEIEADLSPFFAVAVRRGSAFMKKGHATILLRYKMHT